MDEVERERGRPAEAGRAAGLAGVRVDVLGEVRGAREVEHRPAQCLRPGVLAVQCETPLQQPARVEPGGAAPVAVRVEGLAEQVVAGHEAGGGAQPEVRSAQGPYEAGGDLARQAGHHERDEAGDAALRHQAPAVDVPAEEHALRGIPQPLDERRRQPLRARTAGRARRPQLFRDVREGVLGGDEQRVERGVLDGEVACVPCVPCVPCASVAHAGVACVGAARVRVARMCVTQVCMAHVCVARVGVARIPVLRRQPDVPPVVQVRRTVLGRPVVEVGAAEGAGRGGGDAGERGVPARGVVHALLPRVDDRRQPAAPQVAPVHQIAVPGGQPRVHPGEEAAGPREPRIGAVHQPGRERVHRWLHDAGGLYGARGARRAPRGRGAPEVGAREVRVERHGGVEDDVRDAPVAPLGVQQRLQLGLCPARRDVPQSDGDERRVPGPLVRVQAARGNRRRARPVGVQDRHRSAVQRAEGSGAADGVCDLCDVRDVCGVCDACVACGVCEACDGGLGRAADELGGAIHAGLPEDDETTARGSGSAVATVGLRLFNTQNSICNAGLMNTRGCA